MGVEPPVVELKVQTALLRLQCNYQITSVYIGLYMDFLSCLVEHLSYSVDVVANRCPYLLLIN